jgi:hypothetical protein
MMAHKELGHIGDGVYLSHDGYQFWLAVNDHNDRVVALEPAVVHRLIEAMTRHLFGADAPAYLRATADMMDNKIRVGI